MAVIRSTNLRGINLFINPLNQVEGELIRSVNVDNFPLGGKTKRMGYDTYRDNVDSSQVNSLWNWTKEDGTSYNYRASGSLVYYTDTSGTANWAICGNGTIDDGATVGHAVLEDTLFIGDGAGSTRHTTNGTAFTDTTLAPVGSRLVEFGRRIYVMGTSSDTFWSTINDGTNWQTSGTADSSSILIPGAGKLLDIRKMGGELLHFKESNNYFKWDGDRLLDMSSKLGMDSPSVADQVEDFWFWSNRDGLYGYGGGRPQLLSNPVRRYFYNNDGNGIAGSDFDTLPGVVHRYDYLMGMGGTVTDDFTNEPIVNGILKYDYQQGVFDAWSLADKATAFMTYEDSNGDKQLLFGDDGGQVYTMNSGQDDNGSAITAVMEMLYHGNTMKEKSWYSIRPMFSPGCQARMQVAVAYDYEQAKKRWEDIGDVSSGTRKYRLKAGKNRGVFLFVKITESSQNKPFVYYGCEIEYEVHA